MTYRVRNTGWRTKKLGQALLVAPLIGMLAACGDSDSSTPAGSLSGEYYSANVGLDDDSAWIGLFSVQEKNGDTLDVEVLRESDQSPPEGATFSLDYAMDSNNGLTISNDAMEIDNQGQ